VGCSRIPDEGCASMSKFLFYPLSILNQTSQSRLNRSGTQWISLRSSHNAAFFGSLAVNHLGTIASLPYRYLQINKLRTAHIASYW